MAHSVLHHYVNPQIDDGDPDVAGPDEWNSQHDLIVDESLLDHNSLNNLTVGDPHTQYHNDSRALTWLGTRSTSDLPEGSNLYWTNSRFDTRFDSRLATKTTADLTEGSNLYYTDERVDDRVATLIQNGTGISWSYNDPSGTLTPTVTLAPFSTTNLSEGSNLYFTNERVDDRVAVLIQNGTGLSWTYDDTANTLTGNVTYPGSFSGFANPTASVGLSAVNGSATTAMRSDAAPALSQAIAPTWTGRHTWTQTEATSGAVSPKILTLTHSIQPTANITGTPRTIDISVLHDSGAFTVAGLRAISITSGLTASSGTLTKSVGIYINNSINAVGGTLTTGIGIEIDRLRSIGTYTTAVGIRINASSGTIGTDIAIQSLGGENRFVGNVKIGADSSPTVALDVTGVGLFTGQVRHLNQSVRVGNSSGTQTINQGTVNAVTFATESWDNGGIHSTSSNTSRLTASVAGKYCVIGGVLWSAQAVGTTTFLLCRISKNGTTIEGSRSYFPPISTMNNNGQGQNVCALIDLAANDYVELEVFYEDPGGGSRTLALTNCAFSMFYVSE